MIVGPGKAEKVARCQGGQSISLLGNSPRRSVPRATRARPGGLNRPSRGAPVLQRGCRGARRRRTAPRSPSPPPARPARPAARSYRAPRQTLPAHTAASPQRDRQAPPGAGRHKGHTSPGGCRSPGPTWPPPPPSGPLRPPTRPDKGPLFPGGAASRHTSGRMDNSLPHLKTGPADLWRQDAPAQLGPTLSSLGPALPCLHEEPRGY